MSININVGIIGFSLHEQEKFRWIFGAGLERDRTYHLKDLMVEPNIDLLIVKTAAESAFKKLERYQKKYGALPVVTAGKSPVEGYEYHIQEVLLLSRVLKALDLVNLSCTDADKPPCEKQLSAENDSINVGGQYDILVVDADEGNRQLLRNELLKSDIPLNIDFALDDTFAIQKINDKYYDFLFVDAETANFEAIENSLKVNARSSVVMPTTKTETVEYAHVVLRILKSFADADEMIVSNNYTRKERLTHYDVLLIDDCEIMHEILKTELEKSGISLEIDDAFTGDEALEKMRQKVYDFVFLDVVMPGIDGFETCGEIRKIDGMSKLPIIMLSSKDSPLDEVEGIIAGCTTYLTKPVNSREFQKILVRILHWIEEFKTDKTS
ncbi:MAG: response regulator [Methylococcales bacterium]|nr:response regulator [Methylococcales bacterium]MCK5924635.1 response regulator [Methylococcales bacterium]